MGSLSAITLGAFALKLTAWCALPFLLYPLTRYASAAQRHLLVMATLVGALALPLAELSLPDFGPGWVELPARAKAGVRPDRNRPGDGRLPVAPPAAPSAAESFVPGPADSVSRNHRPTSGTTSPPAATRPRGGAARLPTADPRRAATPAIAEAGGLPVLRSAPVLDSTIEGRPTGAADAARPLAVGALGLGLWVLGLLVGAGSLAWNLRALRRLVDRAELIRDEPRLEAIAARCADRLGIAPARLLASAEIKVPIAVERRGGSVVLPSDWRGWSEDRLGFVLLHELAHLARRDGTTLLAASAICSIYWWHPLVHALGWWSRREAERSADDMVLGEGQPASDYANALVSIARNLPQEPALGVSLMMVNRSDLKGRVLAILDPRRRRTPRSRRLTVGAVLFAVLVLAPIAGLRLIASSEASIGSDPLEGIGLFPSLGIAPQIDAGESVTKPSRTAPVVIAQTVPDEPTERHLERHEKQEHKRAHKRSDDAEATAWDRAYEAYGDHRFTAATDGFAASGDGGYRPATSYYNAACSAALDGAPERALDFLQRSIDAGWDDPEHMVEDSDFDSLRSDDRFQTIVDDLFASLGETRSPIDGYRLRSIEERAAHLAETGSTDGEAWYESGTALLSLRRLAEAEHALERAVELLGDDPDSALYNLACARALAGQTELANDTLRRAVEAGFSDVEHMQQDPDLASLRGTARFAEVVGLAEELDLGRFRDWENHDKWYKRGGAKLWDEYARGSWNEAVEYFRAWTAEHPDVGRGWWNLGSALHHSRRWDEAGDAFGRAASLGYRPGTSLYNVACGQALRGETDAAFATLNRAVELGFDNPHHIEHDDDLESLHSDPRFRQLIWSLRDAKH